MRMTSIREFRNGLAELTSRSESILVTRNGKPAGVFIPWHENADLPLEIKREAFQNMGHELGKVMAQVNEKDLLDDFKAHRKNSYR